MRPSAAPFPFMPIKPDLRWLGWIPLVVLPAVALTIRNLVPAWAFMWTLAFGIYAGFKWQTWWEARRAWTRSTGRSCAYLFAWPGMDAKAFLDATGRVPTPGKRAWVWAIAKAGFGATLLWAVARIFPADFPLLRGWTGMFGAILILHFGILEIAALLWQSIGIDAPPLMDAPLRSTSLGEFWGKRWNTGFHRLAHHLVFQTLHRSLGLAFANFVVFLLSGLLHDLVISLPARGGYGLPTLYFALQGGGVAFERSRLGRRLGLRKGFRGWLFMAAVTAVPAFWLFHQVFVVRVILPFMEAIRAL